MPQAVIVAGPDGAGKTTFVRRMLELEAYETEFLNADEISRETACFAHPVAAGREFLKRLAALESRRAPFVVETTLASGMYAQRIRLWKQLGYAVALHFIELPSVETALNRVAARVAQGGHGVPEADVRRRFARGLRLFNSLYKPLPDKWYHWRSGEGGLQLVERHSK